MNMKRDTSEMEQERAHKGEESRDGFDSIAAAGW